MSTPSTTCFHFAVSSRNKGGKVSKKRYRLTLGLFSNEDESGEAVGVSVKPIRMTSAPALKEINEGTPIMPLSEVMPPQDPPRFSVAISAV